MIDFKPITVSDKPIYEEYLRVSRPRGCEFSFLNVYLWGEQSFALLNGCLVLLSRFNKTCYYSYPFGNGDVLKTIHDIIADSRERGIPCCLNGLLPEEKAFIEEHFPDVFVFSTSLDSYDYVYDIDNLATLAGKKYHGKRNHINCFYETYPDAVTEPLSPENIADVAKMAKLWYDEREKRVPAHTFERERAALRKLFAEFSTLAPEGLVLKNGDDILAFTVGTPFYADTFDVHFEKAAADTDGAYTVINREFAKHIKEKYPDVRYLDREEDMGLEGLRRAKQSYRPTFMLTEWRAKLIETETNPSDDEIAHLRALWEEAFGDTKEFIDTFFQTAFKKENCRFIKQDGRVASALYILDCEYSGKKLAYIYAVATKKEFGGRGLCHRLIEETLAFLKMSGYSAAMLVPGSEKLFALYETCGFESGTYINKLTTEAADLGLVLKKINAEEYFTLRSSLLGDDAVQHSLDSIRFLGSFEEFYFADGLLVAGHTENGHFYAAELIGDSALAAGVCFALGADRGTFITKGDTTAFSMYCPLEDDIQKPLYFGLSFG